MASTINASTSSGLVNTADTSGVLQLQTANTTAVTIDGSQKVTLANDASISGLTVGKGGGASFYNTAVGAGVLAANTTGIINTAVGSTNGSNATLSSNTSGNGNNAFGAAALGKNTTANQNNAFGYEALRENTTGANNVAMGGGALLSNTTASNNTAVGYQAGYSGSASNGNSVYIGFQAGYTANNGITGAGENCFVGFYAGRNVTTGVKNTFIGCGSNGNNGSGSLVTTGYNNTILGNYNGNQGGLDIRTASNYIVLSDGDGNARIYVDNNGVVYMNGGSYVQTSSNQNIRFPSTGGIGYVGNTTSASAFQISYNSTGAGVQLTSGATSWGTFSDSRLKNVTGTYTNALADISQLQAVKFTWKSDTENKPQVGVIAQSVQAVVPEAVETSTIEMDATEEYLTVRYTELIPLMIASIQELKAEVEAQALEIATLKG
jgi:hypothetical protein